MTVKLIKLVKAWKMNKLDPFQDILFLFLLKPLEEMFSRSIDINETLI